MFISRKGNSVHSYCSEHPWMQPIRPRLLSFPNLPLYPVRHLCRIHQVPLNPILLCGSLCHLFVLNKADFSALLASLIASQAETVFLLMTQSLLDLNATSLLSHNFSSGCKIFPPFGLYHPVLLVLPSFGSSAIHHPLGLVVFLFTWI